MKLICSDTKLRSTLLFDLRFSGKATFFILNYFLQPQIKQTCFWYSMQKVRYYQVLLRLTFLRKCHRLVCIHKTCLKLGANLILQALCNVCVYAFVIHIVCRFDHIFLTNLLHISTFAFYPSRQQYHPYKILYQELSFNVTNQLI